MAADTPPPNLDPPALRAALQAIHTKLDQILHSKRADLRVLHPEVASILDALDALNRDAGSMRRHGHLGDHELD